MPPDRSTARTTTSRALAALLVALLVLAACSSDDGDEATTDDSTTGAADADAFPVEIEHRYGTTDHRGARAGGQRRPGRAGRPAGPRRDAGGRDRLVRRAPVRGLAVGAGPAGRRRARGADRSRRGSSEADRGARTRPDHRPLHGDHRGAVRDAVADRADGRPARGVRGLRRALAGGHHHRRPGRRPGRAGRRAGRPRSRPRSPPPPPTTRSSRVPRR